MHGGWLPMPWAPRVTSKSTPPSLSPPPPCFVPGAFASAGARAPGGTWVSLELRPPVHPLPCVQLTAE